jgi:sec-independent protein translocase protein TatB
MLDMSWGEILVIGAVALIVIGPKDLPKALRTVGQMTTKIRRMAGEFQSQFNEAMREAELDEVRKQVSDINHSVSSIGTGFNPIQTVRDEMKGAIEGRPAPSSVPEPTPAETVATAAAQGRGGEASPVPVEPSVALPVSTMPPIVDPAHSVAAAAEKGARSRVYDRQAGLEPEGSRA